MTDTIDRSGTEDDHVLDHLIVRFAGDSGDGMQLTGDRFTSVSAAFGNDLSTLPDFPAEIRAPAGTVNGVSAFQVHISDHEITTPGDEPNVLVAMNPAALMADLHRLEPGGTVIINEDAFDERNLEKAGYTVNPLDDDTLASYRVLRVPMTTLTKEVCAPLGVKPRDAERSKNFFALGLVSFMYTRPIDPTLEWIAEKFGTNEQVEAANKASFLAGFNFGETTEAVGHRYEVRPAKLPARRVHQHHRQHRARLGHRRRRPAREAADHARVVPDHPGVATSSTSCPSTSTSAIRTVQAEDEIAAIGMALGAAFAGHLGVTTTSGPGRRPQERDDLAGGVDRAAAADRRHPARRSVDRAADQDRGVRPQHRDVRPPRRGAAADRRRVQPGAVLRRRHRGGPHRPQVPHAGDPAVRRLPGQRLRAVEPAVDRVACPTSRCRSRPSRTTSTTTATRCSGRTCATTTTLARPWAIPGTPGLMHRVGGLEKDDGTGNIDYTPENHEKMVHLRAEKIARIADRHPAHRDQRRRRRRRARARLGLDLGGDRRRGPADAAAPARRWPRRTSCTSTRCPPTSATSCIATSG